MQRPQADAARLQRVNGGQKLAHGSRQTIEPGNDQHIPLASNSKAAASCGRSVRVPLIGPAAPPSGLLQGCSWFSTDDDLWAHRNERCRQAENRGFPASHGQAESEKAEAKAEGARNRRRHNTWLILAIILILCRPRLGATEGPSYAYPRRKRSASGA